MLALVFKLLMPAVAAAMPSQMPDGLFSGLVTICTGEGRVEIDLGDAPQPEPSHESFEEDCALCCLVGLSPVSLEPSLVLPASRPGIAETVRLPQEGPFAGAANVRAHGPRAPPVV